jgi:hypothetical protein
MRYEKTPAKPVAGDVKVILLTSELKLLHLRFAVQWLIRAFTLNPKDLMCREGLVGLCGDLSTLPNTVSNCRIP